MDNTIRFQTSETLDRDSLFLAALILRDVYRTIRSIQIIVAVLLRYVAIAMSIVNSLTELMVHTETIEN